MIFHRIQSAVLESIPTPFLSARASSLMCFPCLTVRLFPSSWHLQSRDHRSLKRESLGRCPVVVSSTEHKYCLRVNPVSIRTLGFVSDWVRVGVVELGSENSDPFTTVNPIPRGTKRVLWLCWQPTTKISRNKRISFSLYCSLPFYALLKLQVAANDDSTSLLQTTICISKHTPRSLNIMLSTLAKKTARAVVARQSAVTTRGFAAKEIKFGVEGRAAMLKGVNTLADAVEVSFPNRLVY